MVNKRAKRIQGAAIRNARDAAEEEKANKEKSKHDKKDARNFDTPAEPPPVKKGWGGAKPAATESAADTSAAASAAAKAPAKATTKPAAQPDWYGKTPLMMVNEFCQKQKWKPAFETLQSGGDKNKVRLTLIDPKNEKHAFTPRMTSPDMTLAKNRACVLFLHHLKGHTPLQKILPPEYRDYWNELCEEKAREQQTERRQREAQEEREKRPPRRTITLPTIYLSDEARRSLEEVLRGWWAGTTAPPREQGEADANEAEVTRALLELGFNDEHVMLAVASLARDSLTSTAAIAWLCVQLPQDALPPAFRSRAPVEAVSARTLQRSPGETAFVNQMTACGVRAAEISEAVAAAGGWRDGVEAAITRELVARWLWGLEGDVDAALAGDVADTMGSADDEAQREDERMAAEAIYGDDFTCADRAWTVKLPLARGGGVAVLRMLLGAAYPRVSPIALVSSTAHASEVVRQINAQMKDEVFNARGTPVLYTLREWAVAALDAATGAKAPAAESVASKKPAAASAASAKTAAAAPPSAAAPAPTSTRGERPHRKPHRAAAPAPSAAEVAALSERLKKEWTEKTKSNENLKKMLKTRSKLPAHGARDELVSALNANQVVIVCGETGCGKTTQVPQFILDDAIARGQGGATNIVCTQPRRLAAIAVAQRVADERAESIGETVGYTIRLESRTSAATRLMFCTTGVLLRRLQSEPTLDRVSHVIVDEVHERSIDSDFLLIVLRDLLRTRPTLRVVLMSATVDANLFAGYFDNAPVFVIPGFTHPVTDVYLEQLITATGYAVPRAEQRAKKKLAPQAVMLGPAAEARRKEAALAARADKAEEGESSSEGEEEGEEDDDDENEDEGGVDDTASDVTAVTTSTVALSELGVDEDDDPELAAYARTLSAQGLAPEVVKKLLRINEDLLSYALLETVVMHADSVEPEGAILVFLPGAGEIATLQRRLQQRLRRRAEPEDEDDDNTGPAQLDKYWILPLHAALPAADQARIFARPPAGVRKLILATNIAETSITVDDVVAVVDSGRVKEARYDAAAQMRLLVETSVSRAAAKQRRGRAGRVRQGTCYKCYSRAWEARMAAQQPPEMHRVALENLCLDILVLGLGAPHTVLARALEPPDSDAVRGAMAILGELGAVEPVSGHVTALGEHIATLPVDVRVAKFIIFGAIFRALDPVLTIAAAMGEKSVFLAPWEKREEAARARAQFAARKSDHITLCNAVKAIEKLPGQGKQRRFCEENFLSYNTYKTIQETKQRLLENIDAAGFLVRSGRKVDHAAMNVNAESHRVIRAALCAGMYPNVAKVVHPERAYHETMSGAVPRAHEASKIKLYTRDDGRVFLHPTSVNFSVNEFEKPYLVFTGKHATSKVFLTDATMVSPYALVLLGGPLIAEPERQRASVGSWLHMNAQPQTVAIFSEVRRALDACLAEHIDDPRVNVSESPVVAAILRLLENEP